MHVGDRHNPQHHLRARGNLSYLQFIRLVREVWKESHPDIPIVPAGDDDPAIYPCIYYSLALRKAHPSEPKPRYREVREDGAEATVVAGQRFQNLINFTAITESNPTLTEEVIEVFENFMMEFIPVFKELGTSEIVFARRNPDGEESRGTGEGAVRRTVSYLVTTERVTATSYERLRDVVVRARIMLAEAEEFIHPLDHGSFSDSSPRYYLTGADAHLEYEVLQSDIDDTSLPVPVRIPETNFRTNDRIYISPVSGDIQRGFYRIVSQVDYQPYSMGVGYTVAPYEDETATPIPISEVGTGLVFYVPVRVPTEIDDQHGTYVAPRPDDQEDEGGVYPGESDPLPDS